MCLKFQNSFPQTVFVDKSEQQQAGVQKLSVFNQ